MPALKIAYRTGRAAALAAVTVGLTTGFAAPPSAAPDPTPGTTLTIHEPSDDSGSYEIRISGVFPMSQADAQQHVANLGDGGVAYDVFHDDHGVGDIVQLGWVDRGASRPAEGVDHSLYAAPEGLRFSSSTVIHRDDLDEDHRWADETDEIYVRAWFVDREDRYWVGSTSNVVVGRF